MIKINITILITTLLVLSLVSKAQIQSPYSQYGLGELYNSGYGQAQAMGGIGIGHRTNLHLNSRNPAGITALDTNSVIYELGFSGGFNKIESPTATDIRNGTSIDYLGIGFRMKAFWYSSIGFQPTTKIDYVLMNSEVNDAIGNINTYYAGQGGLNKIFWTNAFKLGDNVSIGFNMAYNFGAIDRIKTVVFDGVFGAKPSKYDEHSNFSGFVFDYGIQYTLPIFDEFEYTIGLTYSNPWSINRKYSTVAGTMDIAGDKPLVDYTNGSIQDTTIAKEASNERFKLQEKIGFGFTISQKEKLTFGFDLEYENWSDFKFDAFDEGLTNSFSTKAGIEYIPDHKSVTSYFKRASYRFGVHIEKTNIRIDNQNINDYGISFGVGLPIGRTRTSLNMAFELGQRGTLNNDLLKETYGILSLNLSLSDIWFLKRKYK